MPDGPVTRAELEHLIWKFEAWCLGGTAHPSDELALRLFKAVLEALDRPASDDELAQWIHNEFADVEGEVDPDTAEAATRCHRAGRDHTLARLVKEDG